MKQVGRIIRGLIFVLLLAVIAVNAALLYKRLVQKEELPSLFGYSMVTVLSGSMEPTFSPGDMLIIGRQQDYQIGDVVTRREDGSFVTHRIVELDGGRYRTKGDANNAPDGQTAAAGELYGSVRLVIPKAGNVVLFLKTPFGTLLFIVVFLILAELSMGRKKTEEA